jgi:hypothetical protein
MTIDGVWIGSISLHWPFPGNGFYQWRFFSFRHSDLLVKAARAEILSTDNSTNWRLPGWWPFHTNLLVFSSLADFQLTTDSWTLWLTNQLLHVTSLNWTPDNSNNGFVESESYVTTDGQPVSLSWNKAPIWGLRPDFYYCLTVARLLTWGALSDNRTGLSFKIAAGLASAVTLESESHFTVSDSKLPFSSPPKTWMYSTPASTRDGFVASNCPAYNISARTTQKTPFFFYCCVGARCSENMFTEPLLTNGLHNLVVLVLRACCGLT